MLSSMHKRAIVEPMNETIDPHLFSQGYRFVVYIVDIEDDTDVFNIVDFKNEFAAQTYADSINLKNGEDNA